ncbi:MAG: ATP-binding protein [Planctomycetota bacterium]|nr:ATP-binding protein [Planctomycetota bacterium]MDA1113406.1 ATP-binding protein [Planctomycetota bacterium]
MEPTEPETPVNNLISAGELERFDELFQQEGRDLLTRRLRLGLGVGSFLFVAFAALDYFVAYHAAKDLFILRLLTVIFPLCAIPMSGTKFGKKYVRPISFLIMYLGGTSMAYMTRMLNGFQDQYYIGIMLAAFLVGLFFPWGARLTAAYCGALMATYIGVNIGGEDSSWTHALMPIFFLGGTFILTCWAAGAIEASRREGLSMRLQLKDANESLQELDKAKTGFFANVSHELRTPLMLILGPLESLMSGEGGDPKPLLNSMSANAHRLLRQVNTILNFSKIETGQQECHRKLGQVGEVLDTLVIGAKPYADKRNVALKGFGFDVLPEIPHDAEQIETAVANLLSNAMKFTPDGGSVTISTGVENDFLWIEVEDTGCGIPEKDVKKVFDRFHQVDGGKGGKIQGTGLGLALSKELVELHGGTIEASSELGKGTTFRIQLPTLEASDWNGSSAQDPSTEKKEVQTVVRANADSTTFADINTTGLEDTQDRILDSAGPDAPLLLVVEDNPDMRSFVSTSLAKRYRVATAENGELGLQTARKVRPDMIVSDVQMPVMNGFEMVSELRKDKSFDKTPIIMLTAKTGAEAAVKGLSLGAVDYVNKPFKMVEIEARIAAQLRTRAVEKTLDERDSRLIAVGQMTGTIAHDMRGPLTAIFNRIELVRMMTEMAGNLEGVDDDLVAIEDTVRRVNNMIQELLEFVRGNNVTLNLQPIKVSKFLGRLSEDMTASLKNVDIVFEQEGVGDLDIEIEIDKDRIARVLENLINNSRDAVVGVDGKTDGTVWMRTEVTKNQLIIRVADNGPGIPEEAAKNLFQPFATAGKANGTGLGLSIVRNLVTAHDGRIEVDFHPPEGGAAFTMTLPLVRRIGKGHDEDENAEAA